MLRKLRKRLTVCLIVLSMMVCISCGNHVVDIQTEPTEPTVPIEPTIRIEPTIQTEPTVSIKPTVQVEPVEQTDTTINIRKEEVSVPGLTKEHRIFFFADSHISMCDERDAEIMEKAKDRETSFSFEGILPQDRFDSLIDYAKTSDFEMVILGGDILDSAMYSSIEHVENKLGELSSPFMMIMGNHDFEYGSEYFSEEAYNTYLPRLANINPDHSFFYEIYETDELIYFTLDDCSNRIDSSALEAFKQEITKGKPIVVALHVPIEPVENSEKTLIEKCIEVWGASDTGKSRVTLGVNGCYPDKTTKEFINLVTAEDSPVVLVLAGHIHFYHKDILNDDTLQLVTGAAYEGEAIEITLK